jgi:hypothetical protein
MNWLEKGRQSQPCWNLPLFPVLTRKPLKCQKLDAAGLNVEKQQLTLTKARLLSLK